MTNSNLAFLAKSDCKASIMSDVKPEPVPPPYACETIKPYIDKGQLISKCLFGIFNSSKKRTKKLLRYIQSNGFCSLFGRIEDTYQKDFSKLTGL